MVKATNCDVCVIETKLSFNDIVGRKKVVTCQYIKKTCTCGTNSFMIFKVSYFNWCNVDIFLLIKLFS